MPAPVATAPEQAAITAAAPKASISPQLAERLRRERSERDLTRARERAMLGRLTEGG